MFKNVNRDHKVNSERAIKQLKDASFKVDILLCPFGNNPQIEKCFKMYQGESQADYVKIYPCLDVKYTKIVNGNNKVNGTLCRRKWWLDLFDVYYMRNRLFQHIFELIDFKEFSKKVIKWF